VSRVFVTGGSGVIGRALVSRLVARGDDVVALARSEEAAFALKDRGARVVRGDALDQSALERGMEGCEVVFNVAGINSLCVEDPQPMERLNASGPVVAVRAASRAGVPRVVHTSSAATIGEAPGTVGTENTPHRGWFLSTYERTKTEGERAAFAEARSVGQDLVCVNPSSVQGPGRAGGTGRFLLAFLDGRLKVFVPTNVSLVDIQDCVERRRGRAVSPQWDGAVDHRGPGASCRRGWGRGEAAAAAAAAGDGGRRGHRALVSAGAPPSSGLSRDGSDAVARTSV
jgi:dihydroflavonol-4-reductase